MKTAFAVLAAVSALVCALPAQSQPQPQERGRPGGGWDQPGGPPGGRIPPGSYRQSCRDVTVSRPGRDELLSAACRDVRGRWNYSTLRYRVCRDEIRNDNGRLFCSLGGGGRPPQGRSSITLFSAPNFGGQRIESSREITNLPRQFNDRAMSVQLGGRGSWQVCSDSDFRGRCQIIDRDVSDLRQLGLAEAITSLRPVRPQY
jgi:hypothetical protein